MTTMQQHHEDRVNEDEPIPIETQLSIEEKRPGLSATGSRTQSLSGTSQIFVPPNGGLEAWLLVLAGFLVFSNTW